VNRQSRAGLPKGHGRFSEFSGNGKGDRLPLWHTSVGANQTNSAITYELDGKQYVVVGAGDTLVAFALAGLRH
jgi:hypothetical protein